MTNPTRFGEWDRVPISPRHLYEAYRLTIINFRPGAPSWQRLGRFYKDIYHFMSKRMNLVFREFFSTSPLRGLKVAGPYINVVNESEHLAEFRITYLLEDEKTVSTVFSVHRDRLLDMNRRELNNSVDPARRKAMEELLK